jgi:hypothetical protein
METHKNDVGVYLMPFAFACSSRIGNISMLIRFIFSRGTMNAKSSRSKYNKYLWAVASKSVK